MLQSIHKHMSWIMWAIVVLITVTFLFFGIYPSDIGGRSVAKVGGDVITADEYNRVYRTMYDNYKQLLKDQFNESFAKTLKSQALQELVVGKLLVQEAERIGLRISDEELQAVILKTPSFARDGKFDKVTYERILDQINMKPAAFEASQREFLLRQKLEQIVRDSVVVTDAELAASYRIKNPNAKPGEFEKNRETFKMTVLAEKQRDAMSAYLSGIQSRTEIKIDDKALSM
ncbi:MAG: SurA N-terminal domain-containing protein [Nitrospirae bacterium]|nr:SurA N-terminal domain-containing protein [Nitrospirota bacterium]